MWAALEEVLPCLGPMRAPPALGGWLLLRPHKVLASKAVAPLKLVGPHSESRLLGQNRASGVVPGVDRGSISSR